MRAICRKYANDAGPRVRVIQGYAGTIFKPGVHFTRHFLTRFYNEENHLGNQFGEIKPELNYISCHFFLIFFLFDAGGNISDRLLLRNHKQQTTQYWNNTKIEKLNIGQQNQLFSVIYFIFRQRKLPTQKSVSIHKRLLKSQLILSSSPFTIKERKSFPSISEISEEN